MTAAGSSPPVPTLSRALQGTVVNGILCSGPEADLTTPYLVVDLAIVAERYAQLEAALPGVALHYAVKANPAPEVLSLLARSGASFDVASPAEIGACLEAGALPSNLSYGNTVKKERDISYAVSQGVRIFTFDDGTELAKLQRVAPGATLCCRIATTGAGADWALSEKFGCPPHAARELLLAAVRAGHTIGIVFHVGSQQRDPDQWRYPLRTVQWLRTQLSQCGASLSLLNVGGGFPASYREPTPPLSAYGQAISAAIRRFCEGIPRIIAEPGRCLVADAGVIESEVVLVAWRGQQRWVHLDIGVFGGLAETIGEAIQYPIQTDRDGDPTGPVIIAGPTCDSVDILYRSAGYRLPLTLAAGDRIRLLSTGAYTASYSSIGFNGVPPLPTCCVDGRKPSRAVQ